MASLFQGEQRRALIIAAVGFGLVIVLFVGSRLISAGDDGGGDVTQPPPTAPGGPAQPGPPEGAPEGDGADRDAGVPVIAIPELPDSFEIRELRDPFTPPLAQILAERRAGAPGGPARPGDDPATAAARVTLRSIETDAEGRLFASIDVDGTLFEAAEGETFGPDDEFLVVSLDPESQCGLFVFGDEPFTECVDEDIPQK